MTPIEVLIYHSDYGPFVLSQQAGIYDFTKLYINTIILSQVHNISFSYLLY